MTTTQSTESMVRSYVKINPRQPASVIAVALGLDEGDVRRALRDLTKTYRTPEWLRERVNDGYGTPNKVLVDGVLVDNPFWQDVDFEVVGVWKLFERDGWWFGYKTTQNAWAHFATKADAITMASGPQVDIWA